MELAVIISTAVSLRIWRWAGGLMNTGGWLAIHVGRFAGATKKVQDLMKSANDC